MMEKPVLVAYQHQTAPGHFPQRGLSFSLVSGLFAPAPALALPVRVALECAQVVLRSPHQALKHSADIVRQVLV